MKETIGTIIEVLLVTGIVLLVIWAIVIAFTLLATTRRIRASDRRHHEQGIFISQSDIVTKPPIYTERLEWDGAKLDHEVCLN